MSDLQDALAEEMRDPDFARAWFAKSPGDEVAVSLVERAFDEFMHQEGARHRAYDFAIEVVGQLRKAGWRPPAPSADVPRKCPEDGSSERLSRSDGVSQP